MKIKAIITGATGMMGEGVMHECLLSDDVESILVINRRPCQVQNPKLKEIVLAMINAAMKGYYKKVIEVKDIRILAHKL